MCYLSSLLKKKIFFGKHIFMKFCLSHYSTSQLKTKLYISLVKISLPSATKISLDTESYNESTAFT